VAYVNPHLEDVNYHMSKIREARLKLHMTQTQLAALLRTDQSLISKWETGEHVPFPNTLVRIAAALKVREEELKA
jgi:transcriptional regulator with XRE-family HTH domain